LQVIESPFELFRAIVMRLQDFNAAQVRFQRVEPPVDSRDSCLSAFDSLSLLL
jgi:hypothetical protein